MHCLGFVFCSCEQNKTKQNTLTMQLKGERVCFAHKARLQLITVERSSQQEFKVAGLIIATVKGRKQ